MKEWLKSRIPEETRIRWIRRHRQGIEYYGWKDYWRSQWRRFQFLQHHFPFDRLSTLPVEGHFLHVPTGKQYIHLTRQMLFSFFFHSKRRWPVRIFSDGSLTDAQLRDAFADCDSAQIVPAEECREKRNQHFPRKKFPLLNEAYEQFPHMIKILDALPGYGPYFHVLDSDMIFYGFPEEIIEYDKLRQPYTQTEGGRTNYILPLQTLQERIDSPLTTTVNGGLIGHCPDTIDWEFAEYVLQKSWNDDSAEGILAEQTLSAYFLSALPHKKLPDKRYFCAVYPNEATAAQRSQDVCLIHYAHRSKAELYEHSTAYFPALRELCPE